MPEINGVDRTMGQPFTPEFVLSRSLSTYGASVLIERNISRPFCMAFTSSPYCVQKNDHFDAIQRIQAHPVASEEVHVILDILRLEVGKG